MTNTITELKTVQSLAKELFDALEHDTRTNGDGFLKLKDNAPEWMTDAIRAAHDNGDIMPDDYRYSFIQEVCSALMGLDDIDEATLEADTYTSDLTEWLNSSNSRVYYINEVLAFDCGITDGFALLSQAQLVEKHEVLSQLRSALEEIAELFNFNKSLNDIASLRHNQENAE